MIDPHGGLLVNLISDESLENTGVLPLLSLGRRSLSDFEMIANGSFSPLKGFMEKEDYQSVLNDMRLKNGLVWSIPITLPISDDQFQSLKRQDEAFITNPSGEVLGRIQITDIYSYDKEREAERVYLTTDTNHPGVSILKSKGDYYVAGEIEAYAQPEYEKFKEYRHTPSELRKVFSERGWEKVVGFQTRNPIHRAHEYISKCALELVDGLLLHPLVGETKQDDIPTDVRMECYKSILDNYFPHRRTILSVFPAYMRYAGPREAVFHAIVRKNYGCTHFIVGRDHAGIGSYYGTYDAQKIFGQFSRDDLGIEPMFFEHAFYCKRTNSMATTKTSRAMDHEKIFLSGTKVRELLTKGEKLPLEFTRPEVEEVLRRYYDSKNG